MVWQNWFLPHKDTHKKAHLISAEGLTVYILLFILLQVGFSIIGFIKPGVLGIASNVDQKKLIELTNIERRNLGLSSLSENQALDQAAALKAQNMFSENYWAHFSPTGKTPWDFILGSGYKFTFAGENLAKNFYSSEEVVKAWMASPTHRDNLLNRKYKDIGMAVIEGVLNGQKTTLVVQEFGTTEGVAGSPTVEVASKQITVPKSALINPPQLAPPSVGLAGAAVSKPGPALLDQFMTFKIAALGAVALIIILLGLDMWALRKRRVLRLSSHSVAHLAILSLTGGNLVLSAPGSVLGYESLTGSNTSILLVGLIVYLMWALLYHKKDKSLTLPLFLEYLLTAALSSVLIAGVKF